jgi:actin-like ATPase involved in cell morphogenesis/Tfp pilus assembly protein PilZ
VSLRAKCSSWDRFRDLFSGNISKGGLFIPTDAAAEKGESVTVFLTAPDGDDIELVGRVTHIIQDPKTGGQRGLGIFLEAVPEEARDRYIALVQAAEAHCAVRPALQEMESDPDIDISVDSHAGPPPPPPAGPQPGIHKLPTAPPPPARPRGATPPPIPPRARATPPPVPPLPRNVRRRTPSGAPIVGIDFGTTCSGVAVVRNGEVEVLQDQRGSRELPSLIGVLDNGSVVIGAEAQRLRVVEPDCVVASPKRMLGRHYDDPELQPYLTAAAFQHSRGRGGEVLVHVRQRTFSISQLCAPLIYALRVRASEHLGQEVTRAVMTVPVSFDDVRDNALRQAAEMAGLKSIDIIDEPTAAAVAQNFNRSFSKLVAVYDFGGGTFDFSVVDAGTADLQVVATAGDTWLGGDDIDDAVAGAAANAFWREHAIELRNQVVQWQRLLMAAERAKRELSSRDRSVVEVREVSLSSQGPLDLKHPISRLEFTDLVTPIIQRSLDTCGEAMELADISTKELQSIYLSGGTSHVPAVREAVAAFFGMPARVAVPPERAVVIGAAMHCARLHDERVIMV